jgi:predicted RNase H-like nuclease (RuvC/YqgF family)
MRHSNYETKLLIRNSLYVFFFLLGSTNINAQSECQTLLENINRRSPFPSERQSEYENCLKNVESEYNALNLEQKNFTQTLTKLNTDLNKYKDFLDQAKRANDSTKIVEYTKKVENFNSEISDVTNKQTENKAKSSSLKTLLIASYQTFIDYCDTDGNLNALKNQYQKKKKDLSTSQ